MVIWLIGLSGAGKTTLAEACVARAKQDIPHVVLIDGDVVRDTFGNDLGHTMDDRRRNADRIMRLCQWLDSQGIHVVCAILSLFPEHRRWMRDNVADYVEVFIEAPMDQLVARDSKGLYARFERGEISDVAGRDLPFPAPEAADLTIANTGDKADLLAHADTLAQKLIAA